MPKQVMTKPTKRTCKYKFNDAELLEIGRNLADQNEQLVGLTEEAKSVAADFKAKIAVVEAQITSDSNHMRSGYEHREMACTIHYDKPAAGKKQYIRDDNNEVVGTEVMDEHDKQAVLDFEEEQK